MIVGTFLSLCFIINETKLIVTVNKIIHNTIQLILSNSFIYLLYYHRITSLKLVTTRQIATPVMQTLL